MIWVFLKKRDIYNYIYIYGIPPQQKKMQTVIIMIMIVEPTDFETNPSSSVMHPNLKSTEWMHLNAGWWLTYPSEKYEFVTWDYSSQYMEK